MKKPEKKIRRRSFEIRFYEDLAKRRPNFIEALSCLGDVYTNEGFFEEGLKVDLHLSKLKPDDPVVHYNLACSYSLLGKLDEALEALKKAILLGYENFSYILEDKDLRNLRDDRRFKQLLDKINSRFLFNNKREYGI